MTTEKTTKKAFEILHFSVRYPGSITDPPRYPYFVHNLVWRALDPEFKSVCEGMTEEWRRTEVAFDTERAEEYLRGLDMSFEEIEGVDGLSRCRLVQKDGIRRDTVYHTAWQRQFPFVYYIEKFDCFRSWGYTESNAITQACIHEVRMLQAAERMYTGRFATWSHFRRVIECLDDFWD
jgi:hypothetical protein